MTEGGTPTHPSYGAEMLMGEISEPGPFVCIGDEVALAIDPSGRPLGVVTAIYLDGLLELSTGDDDVLAADLVLLRRADQ